METTTESDNPKFYQRNSIYIFRNFIAVVFSAIIFFSCIGSFIYPRGWIFYGMAGILAILGNLIIIRFNSNLLKQRSKIGKGTKSWDKWWLLSFVIFFIYGMPLVAGIDIRFNGGNNEIWTLIAGIVFYAISAIIGTWAMSINRHFEGTVRIQTDRDHKVITGGPYKIVRHPGYMAIFFWGFGFPLLVGSINALFLGIALIPFVMLRTYLEDTTLQNELPGYKEFTNKTRFRLIPGIW